MIRTLYLQGMLTISGRNALRGRTLYDRFQHVSEETLLAHFVLHDEDAEKFNDNRIKQDIISHKLLRDFRPNVVFVEGGLFANNNGMWKIPQDISAEVCEAGGVLIVADADVNELHNNKEHYRKAGTFFRAFASYGREGDTFPVYGSDEIRFWKGYRQILCDPKRMVISEWIRPIYDDVPNVLVGLPVRLASWESLVASCNSDTTGTLHLDRWVELSDACPFAAVAQVGVGFAVFISGLVSSDAWLAGCQYNPLWLTNLAMFLTDAASADRARRLTHRRSPHLLFFSHRSTEKTIVAEIAAAVRRGCVNVWLDEEQLIPSQSLTDEINRALGKMTHFVLFWSAACVGSPWVMRELNAAIALLIEKAIPLMIVRLDESPLPAIVADLFKIEALGQNSADIGARLVEAVDRLTRAAPR